MKLNYRIILLTLLLGVVFLPTQKSIAQDTLVVKWANADGTVKVDALRDAILNDKTPPAGRVYKLQKGGFYWIANKIEPGTRVLRLVGETPNPKDALQNPAVLQIVKRADGSSLDRMMQLTEGVVFKNLYITGRDGDNTQTYYQTIQSDANNSKYTFDNCIFERSNFAPIAWTGKGNKIFITNCKFRNLVGQPSTQQWEGRGMSMWADQDTIIVENNTFFNVGMTPFQVEGGAAKYIRFNHNTLVNIGRMINQTSYLREGYFTNTLLVNGFFHGEGDADYSLKKNPNRDPRSYTSGMFLISNLPSSYGPPESRRVVFASASNYRDPKLTAYYKDTIRAQPFLGPVPKIDFVQAYPKNFFIKDTLVQADPGLKTYPSELIDNMIANIKDLRAGKTPATAYFYKDTQFGTDVTWPIPEDFSYTNATLKTYSTDKLPLGDLNWFPTDLATWTKAKAKNIADLENIAGEKVELVPVQVVQAEAGTLAGGATVQPVAGLVYKRMSSGFIEWSFNLTTAEQLDINLQIDLNSRATSGVNFFVNDFEIHDARGWGQFVFGNDASSTYPTFPAKGFNWWLIKQADLKEAASTPLMFKAGVNKITIKASWCDNMFATIKLQKPGTTTVVKELLASDVTSEDKVTTLVQGAVWTPNGLKSVKMGTNGTVTCAVTAPDAGTYRVNVVYQNLATAGTATVKVDNATADAALAIKAPKAKVTKPAEIDSLGASSLSASFALTKGAHNIAITASNISLDEVQLIQEKKVVGVENEQLPAGYALDQNYPNPFNPTTKINYSIGKASNVKLTVYNMLGQRVATLFDGFIPAGAHTVQFNARNLASGVYFYGIETDNFTSYKKMLLLK